MKRPCVIYDCPNLTDGPPRCPAHERGYQSSRNARPERAVYRDPAYRAMVPYGLCAAGCGEPATTRDHIVPVSRGGTNEPSNIQFLCSECNTRKHNHEA